MWGVEKGRKESRKKEEKRGTFKRLEKNKPVKGEGGKSENTIRKRKMNIDGEEQEEGVKKVKVGEVVEKNQILLENNAGLADRSCGTQ